MNEIVRPTYLARPYVLLIDDEGLLKGSSTNLIGSEFYGTPKHGHPIVGDMLICAEGFTSSGVDLMPLTDEQSEEVKAIIERTLDSIFGNARIPTSQLVEMLS